MGKIRIDRSELRVGRGLMLSTDVCGRDAVDLNPSYRFGDPPFTAPIVYTRPNFEELERRFPGGVSDGYSVRRFTQSERCRPSSKVDRDVAFEYVNMGRKASRDQILNSIYIQSLRPAVYEELLGFSEKYPKEQLKHPIAALAEQLFYRDHCCCAVLYSNSYGRTLGLVTLDCVWPEYFQFLAVDE